jgi:hypothetical protein
MGRKSKCKDWRLLLSLVTLTVAVLGIATSGSSQAARAASLPHDSRATEWAETSLWGSQALPEIVDNGDSAAMEVGVKFRSHVKGWITGIRYYKADANTGSHVGTLWSETGAKLASAAFTGETPTGWQQVTFARRVAIKANLTYVASYHTGTGHCSADPLYFVAGRDNGTLEVLQNAVDHGNGVYEYSSGSVFPAKSQKGTNYWVDVVFVPASRPKGDTYLPWEGGAAYYKQWSNGPSPNGDPGYFPLGVWYQNSSDAEAYKSLGINLFVAVSRRASESQLAAAGMGVFYLGVHKQMEVAEERKKILATWGPVTRAWGQIDEPDNAQELPEGKGYGPCVPPPDVIEVYKKYTQNEPTRPVYLGVGKSVDDFTQKHYHHPLRGVCNGQYEDYPEYIKGSDIVSYDSYPINVHKPLWYVAKGMDELRAWANYRKPVYEAVETTAIRSDAGKPSPDQVKSEVWMLIIHGGMGVIYFCHILSPPVDPAGMLHDPAMAGMVTALNRQISSLAPVLNTPSVANGVRVSSSNGNTPVDVMLKRGQASTYLFTVAARPGGPTNATFTLRDFPPHSTAVVLDENRQIEITNGTFRDDFAKEYEVHIYRTEFNPVSGKASGTH